jgi:hypothetical protein
MNLLIRRTGLLPVRDRLKTCRTGKLKMDRPLLRDGFGSGESTNQRVFGNAGSAPAQKNGSSLMNARGRASPSLEPSGRNIDGLFAPATLISVSNLTQNEKNCSFFSGFAADPHHWRLGKARRLGFVLRTRPHAVYRVFDSEAHRLTRNS